jgi:hypothetical protein
VQFRCAAVIYRTVYGDHHYLVAIALANLAGIYMDKKEYPRAAQLFRDVVRRYRETMPADNINLGIVHIKLGADAASPEPLSGCRVRNPGRL